MPISSTANRNRIISDNQDLSQKQFDLIAKNKNEILKEIYHIAVGKNDVEIFFTTDQKLLNQYYLLREKIYREDLEFNNYDGSETEYDRNGFVIIATCKDQVIGGIRIN